MPNIRWLARWIMVMSCRQLHICIPTSLGSIQDFLLPVKWKSGLDLTQRVLFAELLKQSLSILQNWITRQLHMGHQQNCDSGTKRKFY